MHTVLITSNEPDWIKALQFKNCQTTVTDYPLSEGDIWVMVDNGDFFMVERKTPSDFVGSLIDDQYDKGRIYDQVTRMRQQTKECYVVITGIFVPGPNGKIWIDGKERDWTFERVHGAIRTIQKMGCIVSFCKNEMAFASEIERLIADRGDVNLGVMKRSNILSIGESMLTAFEGIGLKKAQTLLQYEHTPAQALQFLTELGRNGVPGINNNIKLKIKQELGLAPDESLIVVSSLDREFLGLDKEKNNDSLQNVEG